VDRLTRLPASCGLIAARQRYLDTHLRRNAMLSLIRLAVFGLLLLATTRRCGRSRFVRGVDSARAPA
jgi:hypothetical protein